MSYTYPSITYLGPAYPDGLARATSRTLHSRVSAGIQVDLLWSEHAQRVWVTVTDTGNGEAFSLPVSDDERPLDVFHHPYAYAAARGVATTANPRIADSDASLPA
jgi:hypothetical protein